MTIEIPCMVGDTVFADLRDNPKKAPQFEDLVECEIRFIEFDHSWPEPLFTAIRKDFKVCHVRERDFGKFWQSEFGKIVFTQDQYFQKSRGRAPNA